MQLPSQSTAPSRDVAEVYNENYRTPNYFSDRRWLYRPFVKALLAKAELPIGARVLDAGCGQGFFTGLLAENKLKPLGVDISEVGVERARETYGASGAEFVVGDIRTQRWRNEFDCVFTRSCSLYNRADFPSVSATTDLLLSYVRDGGILIFVYHTGPRQLGSREWIYHSVEDAKAHFSRYDDSDVFFSLRLETIMFGILSFTPLLSRGSEWLARQSGLGGELVAFVRKKTPMAESISA